MPKKIGVELIENFLVVWKPEEGSELYRKGFYGKPLGIAKPKIPEFNVPLILDLMEGLYLTEKGNITVYEGTSKKKVCLKKLRQMAKQLYGEFEEKYSVYKDLRESGLVDDNVKIATTVHDCQLVDAFPVERHDLPVDYVLTPTKLYETKTRFPRPKGIYWELVTPEMLRKIPILAELRANSQLK